MCLAASCAGQEGDECTQASEHIEDCGGESLGDAAVSCDFELAREILDLECDQINGAADDKADGYFEPRLLPQNDGTFMLYISTLQAYRCAIGSDTCGSVYLTNQTSQPLRIFLADTTWYGETKWVTLSSLASESILVITEVPQYRQLGAEADTDPVAFAYEPFRVRYADQENPYYEQVFLAP
jgi:hypothetical protein